MNLWDLASVISKALMYTGILAIAGGMLVLWIYHPWLAKRHQPASQIISRTFLLPAALAGLLATCMLFLIQIGSVNQRGIAGMFDPLMGSIMMDTELGVALRWRLGGFMLALFALLPLILPGYPFQYLAARRLSVLMTLAATACFAAAVALVGHASAVSRWAELLAAVHLLAIACWAGALYPLYLLLVHASDAPREADSNPALDVATVLHRFGVYGWAMLGLMLLTGAGLIWLLKGGVFTLMDNLHGQLLLIKILLVAGMMVLGALHKFRWVPRLLSLAQQGETARSMCLTLARSIRLETLLAVLVLLLTATLTSITGPAG